jgi:hypothetical protein
VGVYFKVAETEQHRAIDDFHAVTLYPHELRTEFMERAAGDLTQVPDSALTLDPLNPTCVEQDLISQKVRILFSNLRLYIPNLRFQ